MPQKRVNKTQAIKGYLTEHPHAKPREIAAALEKRGIVVTPQYVSSIKSLERRRTTRVGANQVPMTDVLAAKKFVEKVGGIETALAALDALQLVRS